MRYVPVTVLIILAAFQIRQVVPRDDEKVVVEATVRGFEQAVQDYDFDKANSFLTPCHPSHGIVMNVL